MNRRVLPGVVLIGALLLGAPAVARADQIGAGPAMPHLDPGDVFVASDSMRMSHFGIPNVAFDGDATFTSGSTVTATVTGVTIEAGLGALEAGVDRPIPVTTEGTAELLSPLTMTARVPGDWQTEFGELAFDPPLTIRYTAPSPAEVRALDCEARGLWVNVGVTLELTDETGVRATTDPASELPAAMLITAGVNCPPADPAAWWANPTGWERVAAAAILAAIAAVAAVPWLVAQH